MLFRSTKAQAEGFAAGQQSLEGKLEAERQRQKSKLNEKLATRRRIKRAELLEAGASEQEIANAMDELRVEEARERAELDDILKKHSSFK